MASSSISSFKKNLCLKALVIGALLFVAYEGMCRTRLLPLGLGGSLYQMNVIKVENYVFPQHSRPPIILVGSSMTANIAAYVSSSYNLGLPYAGAQTGLDVIVGSRQRPPAVAVIEVNEPSLLPPDSTLTALVWSPATWWFDYYFEAFRVSRQPINVARALLHSTSVEPAVSPGTAASGDTPAQPREEAIRLADKAFSMEDLNRVREKLRLLRDKVDALTLKGTTVLLHEIPIDSEIDERVRPLRFRQVALETFPKDLYRWITPKPSVALASNDGLHLDHRSAQEYGAALNEVIQTEKK